MSILWKLLLATCLLVRLGSSEDIQNHNEDDSSTFESYEEDPEIEDPTIDRSKRLSTARIREGIDRLKADLSIPRLSLTEPILGSIKGSSLLKSKSNRTSLFDAYSKSLSAGASKGISVFSLMSPHKTDFITINCSNAQQQPQPCNCSQTQSQTTTPNADVAANGPPQSPPCKPTEEATLGSSNPSSEENAAPILREPIVQPTYLMDDSTPKHKSKGPKRITLEQLKETADLRNEIKYAVSHNVFAHTGAEALNLRPDPEDAEVTSTQRTTTTTQPPRRQSPPSIFSFWQSLLNGSRRKSFTSLFSTSSKNPDQKVGSARSDFSYVPSEKNKPVEGATIESSDPIAHSSGDDGLNQEDASTEAKVKEMMAKVAAETMHDGIVSNTVESYANNVDRPEIDMSQVRETLVMKSITEDLRFKIGENVIGWTTLKRNSHEAHALIGLTNSSVVLVLERNDTYTLQSEVQLLSAPTSFTTFTYWNQTKRSIEGIVIVSIQHEIVFLHINEAMTAMTFSWHWPTNRPTKYIKHFVLDGADILLIMTDSPTVSSANLYRFDMSQREFYLRESLTLKKPAKNAAVLQSCHDTFLIFPQDTQVVAYKYSNGNFKFFVSIPSSKTETITAFEMGGHSYLAIGGNEPKILRYHYGNFQKQTILSKSWGFVEYFLAVPARTYRDDLILFVQHRVHYGSHTNSYVEALVWNGEAFDPALAVPCFVNDHISDLGIGCMIDQERELGIIGATMFLRNRTISILIPRHEAPSGLFDLKIELSPASYTYNEHLLEMLSEVLVLLGTREEILKSADDIIQNFHPNGTIEEITIRKQNISTISTEKLELGSVVPIKGVLYNGETITKDKITRLSRLINETENNFKKLKRGKREIEEHLQNLHLDSVDVKNLNVEFVNDVPVENLVFIENGTLILDGFVEISQPIEADAEEFMDATLGSELPVVEDKVPLVADEQTDIKGDLLFDEINGIRWADFVQQIVLKQLPNFLPDIEINGVLVIESNITAQNLNGQSFPKGYVLTDAMNGVPIVTGRKVFKNILATDSMDIHGTLNGVNLSQVITLSGNQFINGTTTFRHLEVSDTMTVNENGTITGRHLDDFLSNPTLNLSRQIRANCLFNSLNVEGTIYVQNTLNDIYLDDLLSDVVYKHDPSPRCNSFKRFLSVTAPVINLSSKLIDGIPLDAFVTVDSKQTFHASKIHGDVFFNRLKLHGLFDKINITEVDQNSIKLFGEQYTDAEFTFMKNDAFLDIEATQLEIGETINDIDVKDFINIDDDFEIFEDVMVNELVANECNIHGDIIGHTPEAIINEWHVDTLMNSHLSKKNNQKLQQPLRIQTAVIRGAINAGNINGFDFNEVKNILQSLKTNEQMLNESKIRVDKAYINGNIYFDEVNEKNFNKIAANAIYLNRPNTVNKPFNFLDPITVNGNMTVDHLNDANFNAFVSDLVRKSDEKIIIYGKTIFEDNVEVLSDIEATTINDIPIDRILTKNFKDPIINPIQVIGDVTVSKLDVHGKLNGITHDRIDVYGYDDAGQNYVIHRDVFFNRTTYIGNLYLYGGYNNVGNVKHYVKNLVRIDRPAVITGTKTFVGKLDFDDNIHILDYNGIDVQNFLSNVVLIDQYEPVTMYSSVIFEDPVNFPHLQVNGDLIVNAINNCSLKDWNSYAIRTDQPFTYDGVITFADSTFESTNINTIHLNEFPMDKLLTLYTTQHFPDDARFDEINSLVPFTTNGLVSGYYLPHERENTLMIFGVQNLTMPTIFHAIRVLRNLITVDTVNERNIKLAASLQRDIIVNSPLSFDRVAVNQLFTNELISGIDFNNWTRDAFQISLASKTEVVTAPWVIKNAFIDLLTTNTTVNGMDVDSFMQSLDAQNQIYQNDLKHKCDHVQDLVDQTQNNIIFLSNFENAFKITRKQAINSIYLFNIFKRNYFLMNAGCETGIFVWNEQNRTYVEVNNVETGIVNEWIHVLDPENKLFLISNDDGTNPPMNCSNSGANIWHLSFKDQSLRKTDQFGTSGEYRSLQMKANSHAFFFALRNDDDRVVELNLQGAIETQWRIDNAIPSQKSSARFVPHDAHLGLALSNGHSLSLLTSCNCANRQKRCRILNDPSLMIDWHNFKQEKRQQIERKMTQLRSDLKSTRDSLRSILSADKLVGAVHGSNHTGNDKLRKLIDDSKGQVTKLLSMIGSHWKLPNEFQDSHSVISSIPNAENESKKPQRIPQKINGPLLITLMDAVDAAVKKNMETANRQGKFPNNANLRGSEPVIGSGKPLVDIMDLVEKLIEENRRKHEKFHQKGYDTNTYEVGKSKSGPQNETVVGSGKPLVDIMDLIDKLIEKNRRKHAKFEQYDGNYGNEYAEVGRAMNKSLILNEILSGSNGTNQTEHQVGTLFGLFMIERTLAHTIDKAGSAFFGDKDKEKDDDDDDDKDGIFDHKDGLFDLDHDHDDGLFDGKDGLFGALHSKHENIVNDKSTASKDKSSKGIFDLFSKPKKAMDSSNPKVGDEFGDIQFKFEPLADGLFDKIIDEMRKRKQKYNGGKHGPFGALYSKHEIIEDNKSTASNDTSLKQIFDLISKMEKNERKMKMNSSDPTVGDAFGDIEFKLEPLADKIVDKIIDELHKRKHEDEFNYQNYYDPYTVGASQSGRGWTSKMYDYFKKFGKSLAKVYVLGKEKYHDMKDFYEDAKFLYDMYYKENAIEDNRNDNKTFGPRFDFDENDMDHGKDDEKPITPKLEPKIVPKIDPESDSKAEPEIKPKMEPELKPKVEPSQNQNKTHKLEPNHVGIEHIRKSLPHGDEFVTAFAIEMIKSFVDVEEGELKNGTGFWKKIRKGVQKTFETPGNNKTKTQKAGGLVFEETDIVIFNDLMHVVNDTVKKHKQPELNKNGDVMVGSTLNVPDPVVADAFGDIFEKFTPLVDRLTNKIISEIHRRQYGDRYEDDDRHEFEPPYALGMSMKNDDSKDFVLSDCNQNLSMEELSRRLHEKIKEIDQNAASNLVGASLRGTGQTKEEKSDHLETTVISIPNNLMATHHNGEIISIAVGPEQKLLFIVSSISENTIKGDHDQIRIFEDIVDGKLFQTISCFKPRSLTAFTIERDTVLAFIQDEAEVKTFIFRGVQGFVEFTSFKLPTPIEQMIHNEVVITPAEFKCPEHYLILVIRNEVQFIRAVTIGNCRINENLQC